MPRLQERSQHLWWITGIVTVLLSGGVGCWWWQSRHLSDLVAQGASAYARGEFSRVDLLARQRLKVAPDDAGALLLAARAAARQNRDQAAIAIYSRLELRLITAEDYFLLGRASSRLGQDDSAVKALEAARAADPDRPETLDELAQVYFRKDRFAAAEETALRLVQIPGWEARGQLMLGTFRSVRHDPAGAVRALRRGFELDPAGKTIAPRPPGPLLNLLVRSLLETREPALARHYLESSPVAGRGVEAAWLLSRCFLQEKNREQADLAFSEARSYRDQHPIEPEPAPFVGAARCALCHPSTYKSVLASRHATTFALALEPRSVPLPDRPLPDPGDPRVSHTFQRSSDGICVESRVGNQVFRAVAKYAFGSPDHFVTLVGPDDRGQSRMLRMSYFDSPRGSGWDVTGGVPLHPADPEEFLGKALDACDGARRCLSCHTTNFRAIEHQVGPESSDRSIGCEGCHGPGGHHVLAAEAQLSDPAIIMPGQEHGDAINQMCSRCHGLPHPETITGPEDDSGWLRFQNITLSRSRCYTESGGKLNCVTCHDPHRNAETSAARNEAKCLSCHNSARGPNRNRPCPVNPARGCIACHMPKIWVQTTHSLKSDHNIRVHERLPGKD